MFKKIDKELEHMQPFEYICSDGYYAEGSSFIQDQEEYNKQKNHNKFLKEFFSDKKETQKEQEMIDNWKDEIKLKQGEKKHDNNK